MSDTLTDRLVDAALMHVPFDGWTEACFEAALADVDVEPTVARGLFPRGALDLAIAYHKRGDAAMVSAMQATDLSELRYRDRVAFAVRARLEAVEDREAVRRGSTLFALPQNAADGAKLIWGTADAIWNGLGDTSRDVNWYTKRATLSAVYSAVVLFWLGDDSEGHEDTWAFLDRRIDNVMQFEKFKADAKRGPLGRLMAGPARLLEGITAPVPRDDLPGSARNAAQTSD